MAVPTIHIMFLSVFLLLLQTCAPEAPLANNWKSTRHRHYTVFYQENDHKTRKQCEPLFKNAYAGVEGFFGEKFKQKFDIYLHPERAAMDRQWQADWQAPDFKSECWMVASGVGEKLDLLSPRQWATEACEHRWDQKTATQRLLTHEMVHVFHGQRNVSPDFSDTDRIDWFVEGLATYASGQCDSTRMAEVKKAVSAGKIPPGLDQFWTGKLKYGLSGSVVMYLDQRLGRAKLLECLTCNKKDDLMAHLGLSEAALLDGWKKFVSVP